jgi:hypothetical protein
MHTNTRTIGSCSILVMSLTTATFAQHPSMPQDMTHEQHQAQMQKDADLKQRGMAAMGFDQDKTTHHFLLATNGGSIEVGVKDASDAESRTRVRAHLKDIAAEFAGGDFGKPFATHADVVPGVRTMQERRASIAYAYEDTTEGGRVRISTSDGEAREAVHAFLRYQIREHATGDPQSVKR